MAEVKTRRLKTWTVLGLAALGTAGMAPADGVTGTAVQAPANMILAEADGEGGGGGEGGGMGSSATYALGSTDANAYNYDGKAQVEAYVELVRASYARAASDAKVLQKAVDALLATPSEATLADARKAWVASRPAYMRTEAFRFYDGPIERVEGEINAWPVNEAYIDYVAGCALLRHHQRSVVEARCRGTRGEEPEAGRGRRDHRLARHRIPALGAGPVSDGAGQSSLYGLCGGPGQQ